MSIFSTILNKLGFGKEAVAQPLPQDAPAADPSAAAAAAAPAPAPMSSVDVVAKLEAMAASHPEKLNWKTSIVDLMKLLGMDSSLEARKELAKELHYDGDTSDSASMNIWLSKQVMKKLAENGGKVPDELKH